MRRFSGNDGARTFLCAARFNRVPGSKTLSARKTAHFGAFKGFPAPKTPLLSHGKHLRLSELYRAHGIVEGTPWAVRGIVVGPK